MGIFSIFKRGSKIAEANANHALDKIEDPTVMMKQAVIDLKGKLGNALEGLAKVKATEVNFRTKCRKFENDSKDWESKALLLQKRIDSKELDKERGEALMIEALNKAENLMIESRNFQGLADKQKKVVDNLGNKVKDLKDLIKETELESSNLASRQKAADISKDVSQSMSDLSTDSTTDLMNRMKAKVDETEALADGYASLDDEKELGDDIDEILAKDSPSKNDDLLAKFRKKNA